MELGAKAYICKPIKLSALSKSIYEIFNTKFIVLNNEDNGKSELYIHQDIVITEIHESLSIAFVQSIRYKLQKIANFTDKLTRGFIVIFVSIPENQVTSKKLHTLLTFYKELDGVKQEDIKIVANSDKIKSMCAENPETKDIEFASTMIKAMQILNLKLIEGKCDFIPANNIHPGTKLYSTVYDEQGQLIKKKNKEFTQEDIDNIKINNIENLYYVNNKSDSELIFDSPLYDLSDFQLPDENGFLIK
jgi:hypothetical protein